MEKDVVLAFSIIVIFLVAMLAIGITSIHKPTNKTYAIGIASIHKSASKIYAKLNSYTLYKVNGFYVLVANITAKFNTSEHINLYGVILNGTYYYAFYRSSSGKFEPVIWVDKGTRVYHIYLSTTNSSPTPNSFTIKPGIYVGEIVLQGVNLSFKLNYMVQTLKPSLTIKSAEIVEKDGYYVLVINETSFIPVGHINFYGVSLNGTFYYAYYHSSGDEFYPVVWIDRNGTYDIYLYPTNTTNYSTILKPYTFTIKPGKYVAIFYTSIGNITSEIMVETVDTNT